MSLEQAGVELFDPPPPTRRALSGEIIRLMVGLAVVIVGFVLAISAEATVGGVESDVGKALASLPTWVEKGVVAISQILAVIVPIAIVGFLLLRRQWAAVLALFAGAALGSLAITALNQQLPNRESVALLEGLAVDNGVFATAGFPSAGYIAGAVALVTLGAPWLSRRWKRFAWLWVVGLVLTRLLVASQPMLDLVLAIGVGMVAGSVLLLVFGSPNTEPRPTELLLGLRMIGLRPTSIERRRRGDSPNYWAVDDDGTSYLVKVRTPNDRSADLLNRLGRWMRYRSSEVDLPFSSIKRRMEHEALMLLMSAKAGVRVPALAGIGLTEGESAFVAIHRIHGTKLDELGADDYTRETLASLWGEVAKLHEAGIAHRHLALENCVIDAEGRAWLTDFDQADSTADATQKGRDVAELLVGLSTVVGARDAVASAIGVTSQRELQHAFRSLQPLALSTATRRSLDGHATLLDDVRGELCRQGGIQEVEPLRLERIQPRTLVAIVAATLAFYTLLPQFGSLDETFDALTSARIAWVAALIGFSVLTYFFATVSFLGSASQRLPIVASFRIQVASSFASLVGPSSTGQMALTGRFLQRAGLSTGDASAAILLDTTAGLVAHILLMIAFFVWTGQSGLGGFSLPDSNTILLVVTIALAVVGIALLFRPLRRAIITRFASGAADAGAHAVRVLRSPSRVSALLGGSMGISLAYIAGLVCAVEAFGGGLGVPQIGTAFLGATIVSTVAPTPGGLGAFEAAAVAALTGFGLSDGVAISSVLAFRLATFWLPILPGWFTFHWMQRHDEV